MARLLFGCVFSLALAASGVRAGGYDDFAAGLSAVSRGDNDRAIALLTSALAAGDLNASLVPNLYLGRARAYLAREDCQLAIADLSAALRLKPDFVDALLLKGRADNCAGNYTDAVDELTRAVALRPSADAFWERAHARWDAGDFDAAAQDFSFAASYSRRWPYLLIWYGLAKERAGTFNRDDFVARSYPFDLIDWPGPVIRLYQHAVEPEDVMRATEARDEQISKNNLCEAHFYVAEWWIAQKNLALAKPLLEAARDGCPHSFIEYLAAGVELKRLK